MSNLKKKLRNEKEISKNEKETSKNKETDQEPRVLLKTTVTGFNPSSSRIRVFNNKVVVDDDVSYYRVNMPDESEVVEASFDKDTLTLIVTDE